MQIITSRDDRVDQKRPGQQEAGRIAGSTEGMERAFGEGLCRAPRMPEQAHCTPVDEPWSPIPKRWRYELERGAERGEPTLRGESRGVLFNPIAERQPAPAAG